MKILLELFNGLQCEAIEVDSSIGLSIATVGVNSYCDNLVPTLVLIEYWASTHSCPGLHSVVKYMFVVLLWVTFY